MTVGILGELHNVCLQRGTELPWSWPFVSCWPDSWLAIPGKSCQTHIQLPSWAGHHDQWCHRQSWDQKEGTLWSSYCFLRLATLVVRMLLQMMWTFLSWSHVDVHQISHLLHNIGLSECMLPLPGPYPLLTGFIWACSWLHLGLIPFSCKLGSPSSLYILKGKVLLWMKYLWSVTAQDLWLWW